MLRYTRNKYRKELISAKLIEKKEGEYFAIPGKVPSPKAFYELIFMTEEGMKTFEVFANFVQKNTCFSDLYR